MKKSIVIILILALAIGAGVTYFIASNQQNSSPSLTNNNSRSAAAPVNACDILTETIAKQALGSSAAQPGGSAGDTSTSDITVSNCLYTTATSDITKASGVSVLARVAKTQTGIDSNKAQFANTPSTVQTITGIGDKAFYDATFHQLNILKGGNWYIVTSYTGSPANATLDSDKKLAQKLQFK